MSHRKSKSAAAHCFRFSAALRDFSNLRRGAVIFFLKLLSLSRAALSSSENFSSIPLGFFTKSFFQSFRSIFQMKQ